MPHKVYFYKMNHTRIVVGVENIMVSKKNLKVLINVKEFYKNIKRDFSDYTNSAFYYSA